MFKVSQRVFFLRNFAPQWAEITEVHSIQSASGLRVMFRLRGESSMFRQDDLFESLGGAIAQLEQDCMELLTEEDSK